MRLSRARRRARAAESSKLSAVALAIAFTAPMQAATISASITAYSTAVGPSSSRSSYFKRFIMVVTRLPGRAFTSRAGMAHAPNGLCPC